MALFAKKTPVQPPRPANRIIPTLWPDYYQSIHDRLVANGGTDSVGAIAFGVGNAIFSTGMRALITGTREFEALYGGRTPHDSLAADLMIDFLVTNSPECQQGEGGWLGTLIGRLDEVLSRPG
jgi:hypothetical protein